MLLQASFIAGTVSISGIWHKILRPLNRVLELCDDLNGNLDEHRLGLPGAAQTVSNLNDLGNLLYSVKQSDAESRAHEYNKNEAGTSPSPSECSGSRRTGAHPF